MMPHLYVRESYTRAQAVERLTEGSDLDATFSHYRRNRDALWLWSRTVWTDKAQLRTASYLFVANGHRAWFTCDPGVGGEMAEADGTRVPAFGPMKPTTMAAKVLGHLHAKGFLQGTKVVEPDRLWQTLPQEMRDHVQRSCLPGLLPGFMDTGGPDAWTLAATAAWY
jgi:hypothetical protein